MPTRKSAPGSSASTSPAVGHTPGPWFWDSDPIKDDPKGRVRFRVVATGRTITQCYYPSGDGRAEADTKLIRAAPDLLFALEALIESIDGLDLDETPLGYHVARAAIAKAKGE